MITKRNISPKHVNTETTVETFEMALGKNAEFTDKPPVVGYTPPNGESLDWNALSSC